MFSAMRPLSTIANVSELRTAEDNTASFSRLQRIFCALCDHLAFVLSDSGENVNSELVRIIDSDELHACVHKRGDESQMARQ